MNDDHGQVPFAKYFLPGPVAVRDEVLEAMVHPIFGHRSPAMIKLGLRLQDGLRHIFFTKGPVVVSSSSATGLMEAAIRCASGDRLLCLINGAFSRRFAEIAEACGIPHERLVVPDGEVHDPTILSAHLRAGDYSAVTIVHSETSTGSLQPLEELAQVIRARAPNALILVDTVSSLGGAPVFADDWCLDFVLTGSQKALAMPPGLAFAAASERLVHRARATPGRGLYFDLVRHIEMSAKGLTPNTPALPLLHALDVQLAAMAKEGMEARWKRHGLMASRCREWVTSFGASSGIEIGLLASKGAYSPTVTCITLPPGMNGIRVVAGMHERGWVLGHGYGPHRQTTFRIGHMGDQTLENLEAVFPVLEAVLLETT